MVNQQNIKDQKEAASAFNLFFNQFPHDNYSIIVLETIFEELYGKKDIFISREKRQEGDSNP